MYLFSLKQNNNVKKKEEKQTKCPPRLLQSAKMREVCRESVQLSSEDSKLSGVCRAEPSTGKQHATAVLSALLRQEARD